MVHFSLEIAQKKCLQGLGFKDWSMSRKSLSLTKPLTKKLGVGLKTVFALEGRN